MDLHKNGFYTILHVCMYVPGFIWPNCDIALS